MSQVDCAARRRSVAAVAACHHDGASQRHLEFNLVGDAGRHDGVHPRLDEHRAEQEACEAHTRQQDVEDAQPLLGDVRVARDLGRHLSVAAADDELSVAAGGSFDRLMTHHLLVDRTTTHIIPAHAHRGTALSEQQF